MKKAKIENMRSEYVREDLVKGIRGKYFKQYQEGTNLVLLADDVAAVFPTEDSVNQTLRSLIDVAQRATGLTSRSTQRTKKRRTG
ncbi:MAG: hypothetical protein JXA73_10745 [Acidobacteria bacterium]|nr:hypothetical protein [Acidobacteriota bacterium]